MTCLLSSPGASGACIFASNFRCSGLYREPTALLEQLNRSDCLVVVSKALSPTDSNMAPTPTCASTFIRRHDTTSYADTLA